MSSSNSASKLYSFIHQLCLLGPRLKSHEFIIDISGRLGRMTEAEISELRRQQVRNASKRYRNNQTQEETDEQNGTRSRRRTEATSTASVNKAVYLEEFDCEKNGPLQNTEFCRIAFQGFVKDLQKIKMLHCPNCHERWFTEDDSCRTCTRFRTK